MPGISNDEFDNILRDQAMRNLERLSLFEPPPPPPPPPPEASPGPQVEKTELQKLAWTVANSLNETKKPKGFWARLRLWVAQVFAKWIGEIGGILGAPRIFDFGLTFRLFKRWSEDNMDTINAAKQRQVFGGKGDIDWQTTFLPFMESMGMYLRDVQSHTDAWAMYRLYKDGGPKTLSGEAIKEYLKAHTEIDNLARVWGMRFLPICDLADLSPSTGRPKYDGPYCGMFFSTDKNADKPFIGLAFKGTSPVNIKEWAVDFNYQLTPAAQEYYDQTQVKVSQGVYDSLFGNYPGKGVPYKQILDALRDQATKLPNTTGQPVNVHVTGHSLGGSYSTLCYAQLLCDVAPSSPGAGEVVMGDEYTFGAPRVGSNLWAKLNSTIVDIQRGRSWRIVNNHDLVPMVPPTTLQKGRDFRHIDTGVHIWPYKAPEMIKSEIDGKKPKKYPIYSILYLIPTIIKVLDHRK
jgi:hypothetical protein